MQDIGKSIRYLTQSPLQGWTTTLIWRGLASGFIGSLLGVLASLIINVALVEMSTSSFFAMYFGVICMATGLLIGWRVMNLPLSDPSGSSRRGICMALSILVMVGGVISCLMQKSWISKLPIILRVPLYTVEGISIAFALIFSTVDVINIALGICHINQSTRSPIDSPGQVALTVLISCIMGGVFGSIFGFMNVRDEIEYHIKLSTLREEQLCYPLGGLLGLIGGFLNEYLRHQEEGYHQIKLQEYDADI